MHDRKGQLHTHGSGTCLALQQQLWNRSHGLLKNVERWARVSANQVD
jgi:hypothetical protein